MVDDLDIKILKELKKKPRASLRELSSGLGIAVGTLQNRMNKLKKDNVLEGFMPIINYKKLGYVMDAIVSIVVERDKLNKIKKAIFTKNVVSWYEVAGNVDVFLRVRFKDPSELRKFLMQDLAIEGIKSSNTHIVLVREHNEELL